MTARTIYDDDIFARPPRALARRQTATLVKIRNCAVCQLPADVLLCRECAEQTAQSKARVLSWLAANSAQAIAALDRWDAIRQPQQAAWDRIQDSQALPDYAARCTRHRVAHNVYGVLLDAQAAYEQALAPLDIERKRLEHALAVLESL